ncbi:unnamed protein product [Heterobilharzia americana]|nr:unnamed protein product [Heterobilharzia americana]
MVFRMLEAWPETSDFQDKTIVDNHRCLFVDMGCRGYFQLPYMSVEVASYYILCTRSLSIPRNLKNIKSTYLSSLPKPMGRKGVRNARYKVKNRTRDIDQISTDLKEENITKRICEATEPDEDRPGLGQFFCICCDKYFIDQITLDLHKKQKPHKRRLKSLTEPPHTQVSSIIYIQLHIKGLIFCRSCIKLYISFFHFQVLLIKKKVVYETD